MTREDREKAIEILRADDISGYSVEDILSARDMAIKALEQEPCEDWCEIPSYEMTLEQARQAVKDLRKKLMEYLEQEPTTKNDLEVDCISRADARKAIIDHQYSDGFCEEHNIDHSINTSMALIVLGDLPSVTPQEPKTGHWVINKEKSLAKCSNCRFLLKDKDEIKLLGTFMQGYNHCPCCGYRMVEPQESEGEK